MADQKTKTSFLAYHYPALQSGEYVIEQEMALPDGLSDKEKIPVAKQYFVVSGERFYIAPDQVFAVFPPKDSQGDYTGCLPHIELKRSTLPWERSATQQHNNDPASVKIPWLALLMVSEEEIDRKDVIPITIKPDEYINQYGLSKEQVTIQNIEEINILSCKKEYLNTLIASPGDLKLLAHVRKMQQKDAIAMAHIPDERAVIVSRSMPEAGKNYMVHLVSLEERFDGDQFVHKTDAQQRDWLVSLYSWRFTNIHDENYKPDTLALSKLKKQAEADEGLKKLHLEKVHYEKIYEVLSKNITRYGDAPLFRSSERFKAYLKEENVYPEKIDSIITTPVLECFKWEAATLHSLLNNLNVGPLKLTLPQATDDKKAVTNYLNFGSVPLPHHLRAGGNTVSWYRSPFVAFDAVFEDDQSKTHAHQHADELIQFNQDTGLLDMSYAAAWELGRLMFINEPKLVQQLQLWKQESSFDDILEQQRKESAHLAGFIAQPRNERLPASVVHFLLQSFRFINFPFNYLIPDNRLLPKESLRFFKIDEVWLRSFLYGVISVGERISFEKTNKITHHIREEIRKEINDIIEQKDYYANADNGVYGVFIHSDAVSGWPMLQVEAYNCNDSNDKKKRQVALLHKGYLSENIMLCLFYGKIDEVVLYLPAGAAHFGFDRDSGSGNYGKTLMDGKTQIKTFTGSMINAMDLSVQMSATTSDKFAIELLYKQDMVTFEITQSQF